MTLVEYLDEISNKKKEYDVLREKWQNKRSEYTDGLSIDLNYGEVPVVYEDVFDDSGNLCMNIKYSSDDENVSRYSLKPAGKWIFGRPKIKVSNGVMGSCVVRINPWNSHNNYLYIRPDQDDCNLLDEFETCVQGLQNSEWYRMFPGLLGRDDTIGNFE